MKSFSFPSVALFVFLATSIGCGKVPEKPVHVDGSVKTKSGQGCEGALIVLHPQEEGRLKDPKPFATCVADGKFSLTTHSIDDGATPGKYKVTVVWPSKTGDKEMSLSSEGGSTVSSGPDQLFGKYGDPGQTSLEITVPKEGLSNWKVEVDESMPVQGEATDN